jgi:MYXO-CTERM domain-containing protein
VLYRSKDNAATFQMVAPTSGASQPSIRGLAERNGTLYCAADNTADHFAVGTSTDEGATWQPLMRFDQIVAIDTCVKTLCQDLCAMQVDVLWPDTVCSADAPPRPSPDGGAAGSGGGGGGTGAAGSGGAGGHAPDAGAGGGGGKPGSSGCHCGTPGASSPGALLAVAAALALGARRRRSRARG